MEGTAALRSSSLPEPVFWLVSGGQADETSAWPALWRRWGSWPCSQSPRATFYSTGPGKLSVWKGLLDDLDLRGDEHVLDIGCGRGAVLIAAAHRLPRGRATGADIWRLRDRTGNSRAAAERNAMVEGVSERVELADADARDLPVPPGSFDVVLSNLTFSNIRGSEERARALREAVRVLRPGGRMRVVDERADRYAPVLQGAGCADVEVRRLDWRTWSGLPGHHFTLVSARKPAAGAQRLPRSSWTSVAAR
jgi:arsenite methyltransferase